MAALRSAGALVLGSVALHELAFGATGINALGTPDNPRLPGHIPGGSSSGSGVAVADGSARLTLGTDTGGSTRVPAALCAVVGFKPAYGTYSVEGLLPLAPSMDHVGLLAGNVDDVARAHAVLAAPDAANGGGRTLGLIRRQVEDADPEVGVALEQALRSLEASGYRFKDIELADVSQVFDFTTVVLFREAAMTYAWSRDRWASHLGADVRDRLEKGAAIPEAEYSLRSTSATSTFAACASCSTRWTCWWAHGADPAAHRGRRRCRPDARAEDDREHPAGELHRHTRALAARRSRRAGGAAGDGHVERLGAGSGGRDRAGSGLTPMARITTPFGWDSTAAEVVEGVDLSGKRAIVTGRLRDRRRDRARAGGRRRRGHAGRARHGRGRADRRGHHGHDRQRARARRPAGAGRPRLDRRVRRGWDGPLHILVNNAGVMALPELELHRGGLGTAVRHQPPRAFALALGLHDALASAGAARIVSLSSRGHLRSPVVFDDLNFAFRPYDPWLAYGQSKTANVLFAVGATRALGAATGSPPTRSPRRDRRHQPARATWTPARGAAQPSGATGSRRIEQGAATSVLVATSALLEGIGGRYFEDCNEARGRAPGAPAERAWRPTRSIPATPSGSGTCR